MKIIVMILTTLCVLVACDNETEIILMSNISPNVHSLAIDYDTSKAMYFVITNYPHNRDSLLSLVSKHFLSLARNDTIERYYYYSYFYFKETKYTPRGYKETKSDIIQDHFNDLLVRIVICPPFNTKKIVFFKKAEEETVIKSSWK